MKYNWEFKIHNNWKKSSHEFRFIELAVIDYTDKEGGGVLLGVFLLGFGYTFKITPTC